MEPEKAHQDLGKLFPSFACEVMRVKETSNERKGKNKTNKRKRKNAIAPLLNSLSRVCYG